ncbi:MAG: SDR family oxidoreductase [Proteobacteria bacterium]|nr:SDR family oxidoreductase [Pseudomonadota bacterium]
MADASSARSEKVGPLEGKVALITGSVRRNGRAMALALANDGAAIVVHARNSADEAHAVAREIEASGGRAMVHLADVADEAAVQGMIDAIVAKFGRLDILINNAANRNQVPLAELTLESWNEVMGVILGGAFLCSRAAIPHMIAGGGGTIINIGGLTGHTGAHDRAHVITAKAGLVGLTKALAVEFGAKGITVNCVVPGQIGGARSATSGIPAPKPGGDENVVGRMGTFEEVAAMVRTLCLPTGAYITGQTIHVNGGRFMP